jgi:hypothetical protein
MNGFPLGLKVASARRIGFYSGSDVFMRDGEWNAMLSAKSICFISCDCVGCIARTSVRRF